MYGKYITSIISKSITIAILANILYIFTTCLATGFKSKNYYNEDKNVAVYYELGQLIIIVNLVLRFFVSTYPLKVSNYLLVFSYLLLTLGNHYQLSLLIVKLEHNNPSVSMKTYIENKSKINKLRVNSYILIVVSRILVLISIHLISSTFSKFLLLFTIMFMSLSISYINKISNEFSNK